MKKQIKKILSLALIMMIMATGTAYANGVPEKNDSISSDEGTIQPQSLYLAAAISEISNEGEGVLRIYADFTSHTGVEWGQIKIRLQRRKSATSGSWSGVETYIEEFDGADYPGGKITYAYTEFDVHGLETGYYYCITCDHKVKTPSGYETKTSRTDGVLLTPYPVYRRAKQVK